MISRPFQLCESVLLSPPAFPPQLTHPLLHEAFLTLPAQSNIPSLNSHPAFSHPTWTVLDCFSARHVSSPGELLGAGTRLCMLRTFPVSLWQIHPSFQRH